MIRTLIIDDEPIALEKLRNYVEKTPKLELSGACHTALEAMEVIGQQEVDLIITDINMPDLNGLDFIKTLSEPPMVIFTTAYPEYAVDSYKVSAIDYLLKPYGYVDFIRAVNKASELHGLRTASRDGGAEADSHSFAEGKEKDSIFLKVDYRYVRVALSDILYIKGYGEYLQVYVAGKGNPIVTLSSFSAIKEKLTDRFVQVHRSYIVNMDKVESVERGRLLIGEDCMVPVSESYKQKLQAYLGS